jgi:spore germination protein YaaH
MAGVAVAASGDAAVSGREAVSDNAAGSWAAASGGVAASGGDALAPPSPLRAFLLAGSPDSLADLQAHVAAIGVVYPTYFHCASGGARLAGSEEPAVNDYAAAQHIVLMPRFTCQQGAAVHRILTEPDVRAATLTRLVTLASNPLYRGLSLDLENDGAADREALSSFVAELAHRLHALHKRLSVVVDGVTHDDPRRSTGFYDERRLGALADEVFVLGWGVHWAGSTPGPIAPLPWVRQVVAYLATLPNASRFVLGVPMYGLDWAKEGGPEQQAVAYQYAGAVALAKSVGATPVRDPASGEMTFGYTRSGVRHTVFYLDAHAIRARLAVARAAGLGVGLWRLGSEDQTLWSSLP